MTENWSVSVWGAREIEGEGEERRDSPRINFGVLSNQHNLTKMRVSVGRNEQVHQLEQAHSHSLQYIWAAGVVDVTFTGSLRVDTVSWVFFNLLCLRKKSICMTPITNWNLPLLCLISWAAGFLWWYIVFLLTLYQTNFK